MSFKVESGGWMPCLQVLYTRTPLDVEERQTTLTAGDHTVRSALDTLTCCCMQ